MSTVLEDLSLPHQITLRWCGQAIAVSCTCRARGAGPGPIEMRIRWDSGAEADAAWRAWHEDRGIAV